MVMEMSSLMVAGHQGDVMAIDGSTEMMIDTGVTGIAVIETGDMAGEKGIDADQTHESPTTDTVGEMTDTGDIETIGETDTMTMRGGASTGRAIDVQDQGHGHHPGIGPDIDITEHHHSQVNHSLVKHFPFN